MTAEQPTTAAELRAILEQDWTEKNYGAWKAADAAERRARHTAGRCAIAEHDGLHASRVEAELCDRVTAIERRPRWPF